MKRIAPCSNCGSTDQRLTTGQVSRELLPDAGGWFTAASWNVVVCLECGLTRNFASRSALDRIANSDEWHRT